MPMFGYGMNPMMQQPQFQMPTIAWDEAKQQWVTLSFQQQVLLDNKSKSSSSRKSRKSFIWIFVILSFNFVFSVNTQHCRQHLNTSTWLSCTRQHGNMILSTCRQHLNTSTWLSTCRQHVHTSLGCVCQAETNEPLLLPCPFYCPLCAPLYSLVYPRKLRLKWL